MKPSRATATAVPPPTSAGDKTLLAHRVRRIEGQMRGVGRMIAEDGAANDIVTQLAAIHSALDALALKLLEPHLAEVVQAAVGGGDSKVAIAEIVGALRRIAR